MKPLRKPRPRPTFRAPAYVPLNEPRPDASKIVAAHKRAQPAPAPAVRRDAPILRRQLLVPIGVVGCVLVAAILFTRLPSVPAPQALHITPSSVATSLPAALSVPTEAPTPVETILAYAAPDGAVLGPIETTRAMHAVAHYGADWVQADVQGSGLVWLRAGDVALALTGPDLAPVAAAPVGRGLTVNNWVAPPAPPYVPTEPMPTSVPIPTDVPIVEISPEHPASGEFGGPGSSSGGDW